MNTSILVLIMSAGRCDKPQTVRLLNTVQSAADIYGNTVILVTLNIH